VAVIACSQMVACTTTGKVSALSKMQCATAQTPCEQQNAAIVASQRIGFTEGYEETLEFSSQPTGSSCQKGSTCNKMLVTGGKFTRRAESPARLLIDAGRTAAEGTVAGGVWANKFRSRISNTSNSTSSATQTQSQNQNQSQKQPLLTPYQVK